MNNNTTHMKNWRFRNPEKAKAHYLINNAVRRGKLIKQSCEICNNDKTHAHHDDYTKPLEVRWLCAKCHSEYHKSLRNRNKDYKKKTYTIVKKRERHTNPIKDKIVELRKEGKTYKEISSIFNISLSQCYKLCNETSYN